MSTDVGQPTDIGQAIAEVMQKRREHEAHARLADIHSNASLAGATWIVTWRQAIAMSIDDIRFLDSQWSIVERW